MKRFSQSEDVFEIEWIKYVEADLLGYELFKKHADNDSTVGVKVNKSPIGRESFYYRDRNYSNDSPIQYYLVAYDSAKNLSVPSNKLTNVPKITSTSVTGGEVTLSIKYNKRKKTNFLSWQVAVEDSLLGYVLYKGTSSNNCRPFTGLIKKKAFTEKVLERNQNYYQIRAYYSDGTVVASQIKTD